MTKSIEQYTIDELSAKIKAIKAERERTESALKRYEEELKRRRTLGVPLEDKMLADYFDNYTFGFASAESRIVFGGRLGAYVEALQKLAKGEPISIKVLVPFMKKGYVAMDKNGHWFWYKRKPKHDLVAWRAETPAALYLSVFNIKPAENWETSLMKCGL